MIKNTIEPRIASQRVVWKGLNVPVLWNEPDLTYIIAKLVIVCGFENQSARERGLFSTISSEMSALFSKISRTIPLLVLFFWSYEPYSPSLEAIILELKFNLCWSNRKMSIEKPYAHISTFLEPFVLTPFIPSRPQNVWIMDSLVWVNLHYPWSNWVGYHRGNGRS